MVITALAVVASEFSVCPAALLLVPLFPTVCNYKALTLASQGFVVCGKKRLFCGVMRLFCGVMRLRCGVMRSCACCVGAMMWGYSMMIFSPSSPSCLSVEAGLGFFLSLPCSSNSP